MKFEIHSCCKPLSNTAGSTMVIQDSNGGGSIRLMARTSSPSPSIEDIILFVPILMQPQKLLYRSWSKAGGWSSGGGRDSPDCEHRPEEISVSSEPAARLSVQHDVPIRHHHGQCHHWRLDSRDALLLQTVRHRPGHPHDTF